MNLRQWALGQCVHPVTVYRWFREGMLPVAARKVGRLILVEASQAEADVGRVAAYCRVSSADQK